ncbi:MAG: hypothetical protein ACRCYO_01230, partial [Bacteroidia bacterium]
MSQPIVAQNQNVWIQTYKPDLNNQQISSTGNVVRTLIDSGNIIAGNQRYWDGLTYITNFFIVKTNIVGDTIWKRVYGTGTCNYISATSDTGFIAIFGDSLVRFNKNG